MSNGPKVLVYDIETSPHKVWSFSTRNTNIYPDQIIEPTRMICWAAQWLDSPSLIFRSEYHHSPEEMVSKLYELLNEADVVVTYNGDKFDKLHVAREVHLSKLGFVRPYHSVDLYKIIRKNEVWASHKLDFVTRALGLSHKLQHHGFLLWREAMGDFGPERQEKAWSLMRRYCKQDVRVTAQLFHDYEPVIQMPHVGLFRDEGEEAPELECPNGHIEFTRQGYKRTKTRRYPQYKCSICGRWFSEARSDKGVSSS